jgi:predicted Rdx family selenoprotein
MASEFFAEGGNKIALKLTPGVGGILQVFVDGDKIFDKKEEDNQYPDLPRVKQMRATLRDRLTSTVEVAADN